MSDDEVNGLTRSQLEAVVAFMPEFNAALTAAHFMASARTGETNTFDMCMHLAQEVKLVQSGNLRGLEAMLTAQAHALDVMFTSLAVKAGRQLETGNSKEAESNLRLALKAQGQCRSTIEAIDAITGPRDQTVAKQRGSEQVSRLRRGEQSDAWTEERRKRLEQIHEFGNARGEVSA